MILAQAGDNLILRFDWKETPVSDVPPVGRIEVIAGVMFSGKTEELIRRVRRAVIAGKYVQVFKSHLDDRYTTKHSVTTHDGLTVEAQPVDSAAGGTP